MCLSSEGWLLAETFPGKDKKAWNISIQNDSDFFDWKPTSQVYDTLNFQMYGMVSWWKECFWNIAIQVSIMWFLDGWRPCFTTSGPNSIWGTKW